MLIWITSVWNNTTNCLYVRTKLGGHLVAMKKKPFYTRVVMKPRVHSSFRSSWFNFPSASVIGKHYMPVWLYFTSDNFFLCWHSSNKEPHRNLKDRWGPRESFCLEVGSWKNHCSWWPRVEERSRDSLCGNSAPPSWLSAVTSNLPV